MKPIRIGALGAARITPNALIGPVARFADPDVKVVAIAARDPARAAAFAAEHAIPYTEASYQALIERADLDLIYIATPPHTHADWTIKALAAGKDVLLEKPIALSMDEVAAMSDAVERSGRRLIEAYHSRYHPMFEQVSAAVSELGGVVDSPENSARFQVPIQDATVPSGDQEFRWDAAAGGGAMMDLGVYPLLLLRHAMGGEARVVGVQRVLKRGVDEATTALLAFDSQGGPVHAKVEASMFSDQPPGVTARLVCQKGRIDLANFIAPQWGASLVVTRADGAILKTSISKKATYDFQLEAVAAGIRDGKTLPTEGKDIEKQARTLFEIKSW
jgi:predicted dehydrogenase